MSILIEPKSAASILTPGIRPADAISLIKTIHEKNMKAGVAISPDTPSTAITDEIGYLADMLLVMTVYPGLSFVLSSESCTRAECGILGRGGQKFLDRCVPKVSELRARFPDKDIEVDGGVTPKTISTCAEAGKSIPCGRTRDEVQSDILVIVSKGAMSLWLEQPSSGRRTRKLLLPP